MASDDDVLDALKDFKLEFEMVKCSFTKLKPEDVSTSSNKFTNEQLKLSNLLDEYLCSVAKTGQTIYQWKIVKPIFLVKLDHVMRYYNARDLFDKIPSSPNCRKETFDQIYASIMDTADSFTQAPFTIQRLCELICYPQKHYKRVDKYLRAIEKNIQVVTTVDEQGCKLAAVSDENQLARDSKQVVKISSFFRWVNQADSYPDDSITDTNTDTDVNNEELDTVNCNEEDGPSGQHTTDLNDETSLINETKDELTSVVENDEQVGDSHINELAKSVKRPLYEHGNMDVDEHASKRLKAANTESLDASGDESQEETSSNTSGEAIDVSASSSNEDNTLSSDSDSANSTNMDVMEKHDEERTDVDMVTDESMMNSVDDVPSNNSEPTQSS